MLSVANDALKKVLKAAYNANQQDLEPGGLENEVQVNIQESPQISSPQSQITSPDPGVLGDISQIQCPFRCLGNPNKLCQPSSLALLSM